MWNLLNIIQNLLINNRITENIKKIKKIEMNVKIFLIWQIINILYHVI